MLYFCHAKLISGITFNLSTAKVLCLNEAFELSLASSYIQQALPCNVTLALHQFKCRTSAMLNKINYINAIWQNCFPVGS